MKTTVGELMTKIEDIQRIIDDLDKMPDIGVYPMAFQYLNEYVDKLKDIKVDM